MNTVVTHSRGAARGDRVTPRATATLTALTTLLFAAITLAGCTSITSGSAVKSGGPASPSANVALLDPGNYPRRPREPLGTVPNADAGHRVEALRMADMVTGPWEVDPAMMSVRSEMAHTAALPDAASLSALVFGASMADLAGAHHYVVGFASGRATPPAPAEQSSTSGDKPKILDNAVLRFATAQDAAAAASGMAAANLALPRAANVAARPLKIPRYPTALANVAAVSEGFEAEAFTAHGPYVLYQYAGSKDSADVTADMIAKTLDLQVPSVDHFQPTPLDQLASLPADPTGLLARTVPASDPSLNQAFVYTPRAALNFRPDPLATQTMYNDAGVQHVSVDRTIVYEAVDPTGALRAVNGLVRMDVPFLNYKPAPGISGLPSARCFDRGTDDPGLAAVRYLCIAAADRYAFKATSGQELDAHQIIAAQYLMLTAS